jgi:uncharacterized membrane protein
MKNILLILLKRNGIVIAVYGMATVLEMLVPQFREASFWLILFLLLGLIWANGVLVNHMSRLMAALLTAVITLLLGAAVVIMTSRVLSYCGKCFPPLASHEEKQAK